MAIKINWSPKLSRLTRLTPKSRLNSTWEGGWVNYLRTEMSPLPKNTLTHTLRGWRMPRLPVVNTKMMSVCFSRPKQTKRRKLISCQTDWGWPERMPTHLRDSLWAKEAGETCQPNCCMLIFGFIFCTKKHSDRMTFAVFRRHAFVCCFHKFVLCWAFLVLVCRNQNKTNADFCMLSDCCQPFFCRVPFFHERSTHVIYFKFCSVPTFFHSSRSSSVIFRAQPQPTLKCENLPRLNGKRPFPPLCRTAVEMHLWFCWHKLWSHDRH